MDIFNWIKEKREDFLDDFTASYNFDYEFEYPSYATALYLGYVRYAHLVYPLLWIAMLIGCIVEQLPFVGVIITSILAAALLLVAIALVMHLLMALETFAKLFASLLITGKLPPLKEQNPVDSFLLYLFWGT